MTDHGSPGQRRGLCATTGTIGHRFQQPADAGGSTRGSNNFLSEAQADLVAPDPHHLGPSQLAKPVDAHINECLALKGLTAPATDASKREIHDEAIADLSGIADKLAAQNCPAAGIASQLLDFLVRQLTPLPCGDHLPTIARRAAIDARHGRNWGG